MNPTVDGHITWERESSCTSNFDEEIERWKNWLHEVTTLNCNMMTSSLHYVLMKVRDLLTYDALNEVDTFLDAFEKEVLEKQHFQALDWVLWATPVRRWGTHKGSFDDWRECRRMMRVRFGKPKVQLTNKYDGHDDLHMHLAKWTQAYGENPQPTQKHMYFALKHLVNKHVLGG